MGKILGTLKRHGQHSHVDQDVDEVPGDNRISITRTFETPQSPAGQVRLKLRCGYSFGLHAQRITGPRAWVSYRNHDVIHRFVEWDYCHVSGAYWPAVEMKSSTFSEGRTSAESSARLRDFSQSVRTKIARKYRRVSSRVASRATAAAAAAAATSTPIPMELINVISLSAVPLPSREVVGQAAFRPLASPLGTS